VAEVGHHNGGPPDTLRQNFVQVGGVPQLTVGAAGIRKACTRSIPLPLVLHMDLKPELGRLEHMDWKLELKQLEHTGLRLLGR
jgi:hypothetical protein